MTFSIWLHIIHILKPYCAYVKKIIANSTAELVRIGRFPYEISKGFLLTSGFPGAIVAVSYDEYVEREALDRYFPERFAP